MSDTTTVSLIGGVDFPRLTLGVMRIAGDDVRMTIHEAIELGYRSFDTSPMYGNEGAVGAAICSAALPRDQLRVTTKLWNSYHGYDAAIGACEDSLRRLGLDYIDLYLIHWPVPTRGLYGEAWRGLIELQRQGKVRAIGVSNFLPEQLEHIVDQSGVAPAVNQVELHPAWQQRPLRAVHERLGCAIQAWSPLGRGSELDDPVIRAIAARHGRSPAQIILHWLYRRDVLPVAKASSVDHMRENIGLFDFRLDESDLAQIDALDTADGRFKPDPMTFEDVSYKVTLA